MKPADVNQNHVVMTDRATEIVDVAVGVFLRYGYKKTSMDAVASAAKLSRQAVYLHFSNKESLFAAVVHRLCFSTRDRAQDALWRQGLSLDEQLLAAFDETMPEESMELLAELLATARELVPQSVSDIDRLIVGEVADRLSDALGKSEWPVRGVTIEQVAVVLQASSYGLKQQTKSRSTYLVGMRSAIELILHAGNLTPSVPPRKINTKDKGKDQ